MGSIGFMTTPCPPVNAPGLAASVTLFSATLFAWPLAILARSGSSSALSEPANLVALPDLDRYVTLHKCCSLRCCCDITYHIQSTSNALLSHQSLQIGHHASVVHFTDTWNA